MRRRRTPSIPVSCPAGRQRRWRTKREFPWRAKKNDGAPTPKEPGPRPADKVERRSVASLVPAARNHRTHGAGQVDQIAASIREWGWMVSVLVNEWGGLVNGGFLLPLSC